MRDESTLGAVRALVVTNMWPSAAAPQRGVVRARPGRGAAAPAGRRGRGVRVPVRPARAAAGDRDDPAAHARGAPYDVVHAHFGLAALPALAARRGPVVVTLHGNDLFVRRSQARDARGAAVHRAARRRLARVQRATCRARAPSGASPCCRSGSRSSASARSRAPRRARGSGSTPTGPYLLFPHDPARPLKRFDRAREAAGDVPLLTLGQRRPRRGAVLDQRRQRRARAVAGRGLRPVGDRGARLRRARVRDAGRDPPGRAARDRGRVLRGVGRRALARRAAAGRSRRPIRASTAARAPSCSPPTAWPSAWSRRGTKSLLRTADRAGAAAARPILGGSSASRDRAHDRP